MEGRPESARGRKGRGLLRRSQGLEFWTGLGSWLAGCPALDLEVILPDPVPVLPPHAPAVLGSPDPGPRARHLESRTWSILSSRGFSRTLHLEPWPGIELFMPFRRDGLAVTPQGFTVRIPARKRALALVGRSAACWLCGWRLVAVVSKWDEEVLDILERGGVYVVSLDRLEEWLSLPPC
jgi:hypothetical protein